MFRDWLTGDSESVSLAVIPISDDPIATTRKLRKGLRDVRDRSARQGHCRWRSVAMAGLMDRGRLLILIRHVGISRDEVWSMLERRYPEIGLCDPGDIEPSTAMSAEDAASLARCRRGIEPLRIVILEQAAASHDEFEEGMPICF